MFPMLYFIFLTIIFLLFSPLFVLFIFRERRKKGERRETLICKRYIDQLPLTCPLLGISSATHALALTGNLSCDLSVPRLAHNPLRHTNQGTLFFYTITDVPIFYLLTYSTQTLPPFPQAINVHTYSSNIIHLTVEQ